MSGDLDLGLVQRRAVGSRSRGGRPIIELGTALSGEELQTALKSQKTGHKTTSVSKVQRLWNNSPLVDPRTGMYYPGGIISCPAPNQDGTSRTAGGPKPIPGSLSTGGIVNIKAGTRDGGEFNRRVAVAGGRALMGRFGNYHQISIVTELVNNADSPIVFSWLTGLPAGRSDDLWEAPAFADDGGGGKKYIPEGAVEVYSDTECNIGFGLFVDGTERTVVLGATVGERVFVPNQATYFAASTAAVLYFRLAPL
jgi:hypothetical protein